MSFANMRGKDIRMRISIEGTRFNGYQFDHTDVSVTAQSDIKKTAYVGQNVSRRDFDQDGYDGSFTVHTHDPAILEIQEIYAKSVRDHTRPPRASVTFFYSWREDGNRPVVVTYKPAVLACKEESVSGMSEFITAKFDFSAEDRSIQPV